MEERNGIAAVPDAPSGGFSVRRLKDERYYDLTGAGVEASGYVPFPSHERREKFFRSIDSVFDKIRADIEKERKEASEKDAAGETDVPGEEEDALVALIDRPNLFSDIFGENREYYDALVDATAHLCNGHPTKAQLKKLPPDVFSNGEDGFFDWLLRLTAPKAMRGSGTA